MALLTKSTEKIVKYTIIKEDTMSELIEKVNERLSSTNQWSESEWRPIGGVYGQTGQWCQSMILVKFFL